MQNCHLNVLFIGDPHLGERGLRIVSRRLTKTTGLIWTRGNTSQRDHIRNLIRSHQWDILLSFYNDLIFEEADLAHVELPLNIHPSLPALRGVGYDILPLIEGHKTYGTTLHLMTREIDSGKILDLMEKKVPDGIKGQQFRMLTQDLCCKMLIKTVNNLCTFQDIPSVYQLLALETRHQNVRWGSPYFSREMVNSKLEELRQKMPAHPVFS